MELRRNRRLYQTLCILVLILLFSFSAISVSATASKKLEDQEMVPQIPDAGIKCGTCPCENPCAHPPPPPPPPPPPETTYCPPVTPITPPPPPRFIYVTGNPGGICCFGFYSRAERNVAEKLLLLFAGCGLLGLLIIW